MPVKVALFGCGGFGARHVRELLKRDDAVLSHVIDSNQTKRETVSAHYRKERQSAPRAFASLEEFVSSRPDFDAALVVTPPKPHYAIASAMLRLGKPVYVEKPVTVTVQEAKRLATLSTKKKLTVMVGANRTVFPAYRAAADALRAGLIGDLRSISIYYKNKWEQDSAANWRLNSNEPGAGLLADHSPHYHHFLINDLGFKPREVRHLGSTFGKSGVDTDVCYLMRDAMGRTAFVLMNGSTKSQRREELIKIHGTSGRIVVKFENGASNAYLTKGRKTVKLDLSQAIADARSMGIDDYRSHPALLHNFIALLSGKTTQSAGTVEQAVLPVRAMAAVERSRKLARDTELSISELNKLAAIARGKTPLSAAMLREYHRRGKLIAL